MRISPLSAARATPAVYSSVDWCEVRLDLRSPWLQERRQRDLLTQSFGVFVHREAGSIGGDLEQDAARLAEIEAAEPVAINLPAIGDAQLFQAVGPGVI